METELGWGCLMGNVGESMIVGLLLVASGYGAGLLVRIVWISSA